MRNYDNDKKENVETSRKDNNDRRKIIKEENTSNWKVENQQQ